MGEYTLSSPQNMSRLELQTKVRKNFTIMEKAPTWAFTWLKASTVYYTSTFTFNVQDTVLNGRLNTVSRHEIWTLVQRS